MTELLLIIALCVLALIVWELLYDRSTPTGSASRTPPPLRQPTPTRSAPRTRQPKPRFNGRLVPSGAVPPRTANLPGIRLPPTRSRLQNGVRVTAVKNGRAVIPDDAIGLACLRPIAECSLGDRCVCLGQQELRTGNRL